jgi:hypothetical protein
VTCALMRKANVTPLTATAHPRSPLLRSIAGEPAAPAALRAWQPAPEPATVTTLATDRAAAAISSRYRGGRSR